jgi:hypothetical protein
MDLYNSYCLPLKFSRISPALYVNTEKKEFELHDNLIFAFSYWGFLPANLPEITPGSLLTAVQVRAAYSPS